MPLWGFLLSFVTATLWAASPIIIDRARTVSNFTSNEINPIRSISFLAASFALAYIYTGGSITLVTSTRAYVYLVLGIIVTYMMGDILYFAAIREIGVTIAIPISNAYPILVAFTSWFLVGEAPTLKLLLGVIIVVAGLILLRFGGIRHLSAENSKDSGKKFMKGFLLAVAAALCWSMGAPLTKLSMIETGLGAVEFTFYRAATFFVVAWLFRAVAFGARPESCAPFMKISPRAWWYLLSASVISLCAGSLLYAICLEIMPVAAVTAITSTSPFMAALFGHFVLKERLRGLQWCGVIMIISGSVLVSI